MSNRERNVFMEGTYDHEMPDTGNRPPLIVPTSTAPQPWNSENFGRYDGPSEVHRWAVAKRLMKAVKGKNIPI